MKIIRLLNTINPNIYYFQIYEYLFGTIRYRKYKKLIDKLKSVVKYNSKINGEIIIDKSYNIIKNLMKGESVCIKCQKPFFFNMKYNIYLNMKIFNGKIKYINKILENIMKVKNTKYSTIYTKIINNTYEITLK
tara:strand:- start:263 stop:664 length:402 start_codon:yes stop_codon:yes gene_type:complete